MRNLNSAFFYLLFDQSAELLNEALVFFKPEVPEFGGRHVDSRLHCGILDRVDRGFVKERLIFFVKSGGLLFIFGVKSGCKKSAERIREIIECERFGLVMSLAYPHIRM